MEKLNFITKGLDSIVALIGQASQSTAYYRKHMILESLLSDHKKAKSMLSNWEEALSDNFLPKNLFGDKFEEELCNGRHLLLDLPQIVIETDASKLGLGAV